MESILNSVKKMLGIDAEYDHFDDDLIFHINSVLMTLTQLGVGPAGGFFIEDDTATWGDFLEDITKLHAVKSYMYLKVKLLFDPPTNSPSIDNAKRQAAEMEWRLNMAVDPPAAN